MSNLIQAIIFFRRISKRPMSNGRVAVRFESGPMQGREHAKGTDPEISVLNLGMTGRQAERFEVGQDYTFGTVYPFALAEWARAGGGVLENAEPLVSAAGPIRFSVALKGDETNPMTGQTTHRFYACRPADDAVLESMVENKLLGASMSIATDAKGFPFRGFKPGVEYAVTMTEVTPKASETSPLEQAAVILEQAAENLEKLK